VLRGCFFTFRHYDAVKDKSQVYYSWIFVWSSIISSLFLGILAGAATLGRIDTSTTSFYEGFIYPWFNEFSFAVGIFACCIFSFLAAVYLIGETKEEELRKYLLKQAFIANIITVIAGSLVFLAAYLNNFNLIDLLLSHLFSAVCLVLATVSLPLLWIALRKRQVILPRILAGFQVLMILTAWLWLQYPAIVNIANGPDLTLHNSVAPEATIRVLGWALMVGSMLILPALYYLLRSFKFSPEGE
jgi:cytochrome d ubiquinol oxidase subunit II